MDRYHQSGSLALLLYCPENYLDSYSSPGQVFRFIDKLASIFASCTLFDHIHSASVEYPL